MILADLKKNQNIFYESKEEQLSFSDIHEKIQLEENNWSEKIKIIESTDILTITIQILTAYFFEKTFCILPMNWPDRWKESVRKNISKFSNMIPNNTFYLLPTSGSTGLPKLVVVTKKNFSSFLISFFKSYSFEKKMRISLTYEPNFDPFLAIIFMALKFESTLVPLPKNERFDIESFLTEKKIQFWSSVPSLIALNRFTSEKEIFPELKYSLFTGETLSKRLLKKWEHLAPNSINYNFYGPVESTIWVTGGQVFSDCQTDTLSIGTPFESNSIEILQDKQIIIKGDQVAEGYLTEDGLIKFNQIYSSGDLGLFEDNKIFLHGRIDNQIKLLGARIDLEAIETKCQSFLNFFAVVSVFKKDFLTILVQEEDFKRYGLDQEKMTKLFQFLKENLPQSHLPKKLFLIDKYEFLPSGKLNRRIITEKLNSGVLNEVS